MSEDIVFDNWVIDELGGTSAVARIFDIKPASVSEWRKDGIPKPRRQYLQLFRPSLFKKSRVKANAN